MSEENPKRYSLRIQPRAARDIEAHLLRVEETSGEEVARDWREGLLSAISTLALNPRRCARIPEQTRFRHEIRQLLYRRTSGGPAWRILFVIADEAEDAATVNLLHIRHSAQRPVTKTEARQIEISGQP